MPLPPVLAQFVEESQPLDRMTRTLLLLDYADRLGPYPEEKMDDARRVRGCASRVYLDADYDASAGAMRYQGWADAETVKGLVAVLVTGLDGLPPPTCSPSPPTSSRPPASPNRSPPRARVDLPPCSPGCRTRLARRHVTRATERLRASAIERLERQTGSAFPFDPSIPSVGRDEL